MDIRNLFLILWLSTIAGIVSGAILVVYGEPTFPAAPMGMCMDGVDILDGQYPNSSIVYAYDPYPAPGHAWIILNGSTPVDPYYGVEDATYEWLHPQHTFTTFAELQAGHML